MSSGNRPSSKLGTDTSSTAAQDEDCFAWLQYPTDDVFERSYCCSDLFQEGWALASATEERQTLQSSSEVFTHEREGSVSKCLETSVCLNSSQTSTSLTGRHMGSNAALTSRPLSKVDAEGALAQGAARAAGYSWPVGQNSFNKIRTLMQPGDANPRVAISGETLSSSKQFTDSTFKLNSPVSPVPASMPNALHTAKSTKMKMVTSHPANKAKQATSESALFSSKRPRTEYESLSESSHVTETGTTRRGKDVLVADGRKWASMSYSGASQISTSLSESGTADTEKLKQEYFELLLDDLTEDDFTDTKKRLKLPLKRNRIPEVHNLSERIRRNKINEKLKALQDLVPNSSKTDKASVLDEAIEYMKALQMQLQMVSMRDNLNVSSMMMPTSVPQMRLPIAQPQSIGIGVPIGHAGMGMSLGVMPETRLPMAATLYQCPTAMMSQMHAMPYNSQNMAGFAHMGFPQNAQILPTIANTHQRPICMQRHQELDKGWSHQQFCNLESKTASMDEQDDFSD